VKHRNTKPSKYQLNIRMRNHKLFKLKDILEQTGTGDEYGGKIKTKF